ncbi:serine/threonine-protein kinase, partial [Verticillium dahliae]
LAERRKSDSEVKKDIQRLQQEETELVLSASSAAGEHRQSFQRRLDAVRKERTSLSRVLFHDKTQRVDLLWMLENEKQERWTADFFSALQRLDPSNRLLVVWCLYPGPRTSRLRPFPPSDHWKCTSAAPGGVDVMEMMTNRIREKSTRTRGEMIVINCGDPDFTMRMRAGVIAAMGGRTFIEFVESEYQPRPHRPIDAVVAGQAGGRGAGKRVWGGKRNAASRPVTRKRLHEAA